MVLFIVSSLGSSAGYGGHYYSLMHIAREVSKKLPVKIINIGDVRAPALKNWSGDIQYLKTSLCTVRHTIKNLSDLCRKLDASILHSFDLYGSYFARKISLRSKIPCVSTKAGGPVPYQKLRSFGRWLYPSAQIQTVFHEIDYQWFMKKGGFKILKKISARVKKPKQNLNRSKEIEKFFTDADLKIIRIARITDSHFLSIKQSILFTQLLNKYGIKAKLAVIGSVNSKTLFRKVKIISNNETMFFTKNDFTVNASDFLGSCNIVIGTGRNFMEGCAAGRVMMAPVTDSQYPALVTPNNIKLFEKANFSNRVRKNMRNNPDRDYLEYIDIITNPHIREKLGNEMAQVFEKRYDARMGAEAYMKIYHTAIKDGIYEHSLINLLQNKIILTYTLLRSFFKII